MKPLFTNTPMFDARLILCTAALFTYGCASVPKTISTPIAGPEPEEVRAAPESYIGVKVRWGGTITKTENLQDRTVVTVVARRTARNGEPLGNEPSTGRFIMEVDRFLDPEEYEPGRRITAIGTISQIRQEKIDQFIYDYPVVDAENVYLWAVYVRREPYPYYGWPYHPYWGYPWHRHHLHGFGHYPWYY